MSHYIGNRYQIIKAIGRGGMADVYLALDTILNREVAVKVLKSDMSADPVARERFNREAIASTKLSHPNIVDVYDVGEDGDRRFIVMEYVKGFTLKQLIQKRGALPCREAVWIMRQLAGALMEAHRNGIIHRDVKSQNVLIKNDGTIKMADFGIALAQNAMQITSKDSVLGSVHYLAPELASGKQASMQSDIYSLGIVFYELLTGELPFKGDTPVEIALKHVKEEIPSVRKFNPDIPQSVENIIIKATAKNPKNRYSNVAFMLKDLNVCLNSEHLNDEKIVFEDNKKDNKNIHISKEADKSLKKKTKKTAEDRVFTAFIICISVLSIILLGIILVLSGVFKNDKNKVYVPNLTNYSIVEANDILENAGLVLDKSNIERELTDNVEEGLIISSSPAYGEKVDKGSSVRVVVSEGIYSTIGDYVGQKINDVKPILNSLNIIVQVESVESDYEPGTIIEQKDLAPGSKYNPSINNYVTFVVSASKNLYIDFNVLGRGISEVYDEYVSQGFNVEVVKQDASFFTEEEIKKYGPNTVIRTNPEPGNYYEQSDGTSVQLYYYE